MCCGSLFSKHCWLAYVAQDIVPVVDKLCQLGTFYYKMNYAVKTKYSLIFIWASNVDTFQQGRYLKCRCKRGNTVAETLLNDVPHNVKQACKRRERKTFSNQETFHPRKQTEHVHMLSKPSTLLSGPANEETFVAVVNLHPGTKIFFFHKDCMTLQTGKYRGNILNQLIFPQQCFLICAGQLFDTKHRHYLLLKALLRSDVMDQEKKSSISLVLKTVTRLCKRCLTQLQKSLFVLR